jgi:transglutaminase-like putative cysteine protease
LQLRASDPVNYVGGDAIIETTTPEIVALAGDLRRANADDGAFARVAYEWVRDRVAHSLDAQDPRVTLTASEVLSMRVGLCYAKSHLLVALLRTQGVPAGLCYQRLAADGPGSRHCLHGLIAIYLNGEWRREDPRGNKPGVNAQFSLTEERLAYRIDPALGEIDYPDVYVVPAVPVVAALRTATNILTLCDGGLPSSLL